MEEREIHLRDYWRIIRKRGFAVVSFFIITFSLTVVGVYTSNLEPEWRSSTKLLIEKGDTSLSLAEAQGYVRWDPNFLQTQFQIIRSKPVAEKVVAELGLDTRYLSLFINPDEKPPFWVSTLEWAKEMLKSVSELGKKEGAATGANAKKEATDAQIIIAHLLKEIEITPTKESRIVEIAYTSDNAMVASMIVNAFTRAYIDELLEMRMRATGHTVDWMTRKAGEQRKELEKAEKKLNSYMRRQDIVAIENSISIGPQRINEITGRITAEKSRAEELKALVTRLKGMSLEESLFVPGVSDHMEVQRIRQEVARQEQTILEYSKKYGKRHPVMVRANNDLALLKAKLAEEARRVIGTIGTDYELAKENIVSLEGQLMAARGEAITLNEKYVQYKILQRDVETYRHLYNALIAKIKEQTLAEEVQPVNVWTVERAEPPLKPVDSHRLRNLLLGLLLGLFGGVGLAFFTEYLDNTVKSVEEVEERFKLPVLSVIPRMKAKDGRIEEVVKALPLSSISEGYKTLRASIMLTGRGTPPKCLLFTSMAPSDGKTTSAVNLATALANSGRRVVLMDADLRKPTLHKLMGQANDVGLSSYLSGLCKEVAIQETEVSKLSIITSGPIPPIPSELLGLDRFRELVTALHGNFDVVVIDSPPVMPVSDSLVLSQVADATVVVVRSGKTTFEVLERGLKALHSVGTEVKGLVINAADPKRGAYAYYEDYGYGYYGGYASEPDDIMKAG